MLKKLKSLFIIEEKAKAESQQKADQKTTAESASASSTSKSSSIKVESTPGDPSKGKPDEKFINRLLGALEENNIDGFDYLEYKQSLQNLGGVEMDEGTKFKSALAMAKTMGASSEKLMSSAQHYLTILAKEEHKFLEAFKNQQSLQVSSRNKEIQLLDQKIKQSEAQIAKLQKEIDQAKNTMEKKKNSINKAQVKVQATKDNFYHSYHIVREQISADIDKMKKYLS